MKVAPDVIHLVKHLCTEGLSQAKIALKVGIAQSTVGYILDPGIKIKRQKDTQGRRLSLTYVEKERRIARGQGSRRRQRESYKQRARNYQSRRKQTDTLFAIAANLRSRLWNALKGNFKSGSAVRDLGCSIDFLKQHLELQFQERMTWENYGEWHIDHKKPLASFDLTNRKQFLEACHYTNLQPLWAADNIRKGSK